MLAKEQVARYARQLILPEVGIAGQKRLSEASVLVVGAGGLGTPALLYLAGAGVGRLGIVDDDVVDVSNLHRQVIHDSAAVGKAKAGSAAARIAALNPHVSVAVHAHRLVADNARSLFDGYDLVIDASDNFPTRYLVNDACVFENKPLVFGAVSRYDGQVAVLVNGVITRDAKAGHDEGVASGGETSSIAGANANERPPCYRCLFPSPPAPGTVPSCAEAGVIGPLPAVVGGYLASEALKLILGIGDPLLGRLLLVDLLAPATTPIAVERDRACQVCGDSPTIIEPVDYDAFCGVEHPARGSPRS